MTERKTKTVLYETLGIYELEGNIDEVIEKLGFEKNKIVSDYPEAECIRLDADTEYGMYGDSDREVLRVYFDRPETDAEMNGREEITEKTKVEQYEKRYKEYLTMKKEFEGK